MIRLHLLGFTPDLTGLVFSGRRGGRSGTYWVSVDDAFRKALGQLEQAREEAVAAKSSTRSAGAKRGSAPKAKTAAAKAREIRWGDRIPIEDRTYSVTDTQDLPLPPATPRVESKLSPREIQQLLREGRSVKEVAALAGVELAWVERFLGPVSHEMAGVVQMTRDAFQTRPRLGLSGLAIGEAVERNLRDRRATSQTLEQVDEGWEARRVGRGIWRVRLRFGHRGKRRVAEWEVRTDTREARPRNKVAVELGWWPPDARRTPRGVAETSSRNGAQRAAKPAPASRGSRPSGGGRAAKAKAATRSRAAAKTRSSAKTAKTGRPGAGRRTAGRTATAKRAAPRKRASRGR